MGKETQWSGENVAAGEKWKGWSWEISLRYREDFDLEGTHSLEKSVCGLGLLTSQ